MASPLILAVDLDGVLHDYKNPLPGRRMGGPLPGAIDSMNELHDQGHKLIIHSVRGGKSSVVADWCDYYDIPYDEITNVKPNADYYIDDRAIHFDSWPQVMSYFPEDDD